jgi:PKD repeat protein
MAGQDQSGHLYNPGTGHWSFNMSSSCRRCAYALVVTVFAATTAAEGATRTVPAGGDLQATLDAAAPGDTILLAAGAEFVGNFVLPVKTGSGYIVLRTSTPLTALPGAGTRIQPAHAALLARLRSPNEQPALRTAPGAHHWHLQYLEFAANLDGLNDLVQLGDGSSAQSTLASVPYALKLDHLYVHGDPDVGQKRCIALNAGDTTIRDSYIADCKSVSQDSQAIGGWNGPGPYLIENNYLEGAGENVMFGGADPWIDGLVGSGITIRRNYFTRPMAWRNPVIPTPAGATATPLAGGGLGAGTYAYRVIARRGVGQGNIGRSTATAEVTATVADGGTVRVRWQAVPGAAEYRVYGRSPGSQTVYWTVTTTEFVDTGAAGTPENVPTSIGTQWLVKNLFELKSARGVVVEGNIFENHWKQGQPGFAIVLTPRNSGGRCTWCVVEDLRFEHNVVRNVAAGVNILGYDNARPTQQTNALTFRHNLFYNVTTALGGNGWFMQIGDGPRDITIEHNTIDHNGPHLVYVYGGTSTAPKQVLDVVMTSNAARNGTYGMGGAFYAAGNAILTNFYPGIDFRANYLSGAVASRYPAGTLVAGLFPDQFVNAGARDYTVRSTSALHNAGTDGTDIGVDMAAVTDYVDGVETGSGSTTPPVAPVADFSASCTALSCAFTDGSSDADGTIASRTWTFGDGTTSSAQDPVHEYDASGTYAVTLAVVDNSGLSASKTRSVTVTQPNAAPAASFTSTCADLTCTLRDTSTDSDGTIALRTWTFGDGTASGSGQQVTHTFAAAGTYSVTLTVRDDDGATATATRTVSVAVSIHSGDLDGTTTQWSKYWDARVTIVVHDGAENRVNGATVAFTWSGAVSKTGTCVTSAGWCTVKSGTLSHLRSSVTLTINSISVPGSTYLAGSNHDVDGSTGGTAVVIARPPIPGQ